MPPPAEGSDDDFEAPAAPRGSAPPSGTQGAASQPAVPEKKGPNKYVKAMDRGVQEQVYLYINGRLQVGRARPHSFWKPRWRPRVAFLCGVRRAYAEQPAVGAA